MNRILKLCQWTVIKQTERITKQKYVWKKYGGQEFIGIAECNKTIFEAIKNNTPFMAGRFGGYELSAAVKFEYKNDPFIPASKLDNAAHYLCSNAGFFPKRNEMIYHFSDIMKEATREADLIAVWFNSMEDYWIDKYRNPFSYPQMVNTLRGLEPWYSDIPWTTALEGKKVLVIHPFAETIRSQFKRKDKIFPNFPYLPDFDLLVLKAVQSIGGCSEYTDWFEALETMYKHAMNMEFDVAIIGCGAYGFPLAAKLKRAGKVVVHMGGATQLLFGIMGERWTKNPRICELQNEYWVRPSKEERPKNAELVEGACYW